MRSPPEVRTRTRPEAAVPGNSSATRGTGCPAKAATAGEPCAFCQRRVPFAMSGVPRISQASEDVAAGLLAGAALGSVLDAESTPAPPAFALAVGDDSGEPDLAAALVDDAAFSGYVGFGEPLEHAARRATPRATLHVAARCP